METKEIGFNTRCENLHRDLVNIINESNLPIGTIFYIAKSIMVEVETTYYGAINNEAKEYSITNIDANGGNE